MKKLLTNAIILAASALAVSCTLCIVNLKESKFAMILYSVCIVLNKIDKPKESVYIAKNNEYFHQMTSDVNLLICEFYQSRFCGF